MTKTTLTATQLSTLEHIGRAGEAGCHPGNFYRVRGFNLNSVRALLRLKLIERIPSTAGLVRITSFGLDRIAVAR